MRSGYLIILSAAMNLFLILNLLGGENLTLGITWRFNAIVRLILPLVLFVRMRAFTLFFGSVWVLMR